MRTRFPYEPNNAIRIGSVRTFLDALEKIKASDNTQLYYRGHESFKYKLEPSVYRDKNWLWAEKGTGYFTGPSLLANATESIS